MSIKLDKKIDDLKNELNFPDGINELNQLRDALYEKMSSLAAKISDNSTDLTEFYQENIKQDRTAYITEGDDVYKQAKTVDSLVNEYNNTCILIELVEKKIDKQQ